ncbi:MAG: hypothetical protein ACLFP1_01025 [Candidatus Goldiibacteriota bacterium]
MITEEYISGKKTIIYIRALLSTVLILLAAYHHDVIMTDASYIIFFVIILISSNFIFIALPDRLYSGMTLHYIIFIVDIIFVSLGAYWLANLDFMFMMVIFLTIFMSALSRSVKMSVLIAIVVNLVYLYATAHISGGGLNYLIENNLLLNIPFLFIVAFHGSYMAEKSETETEEKNRLQKSNIELAGKVKKAGDGIKETADFAENVYDAFLTGVIIMDNAGRVLFFNRYCEKLFNTRRSKIINLKLSFLKGAEELEFLYDGYRLKKHSGEHKNIVIEGGGLRKNVSAEIVMIKDKDGNEAGSLAVLRQIFPAKEKEHT